MDIVSRETVTAESRGVKPGRSKVRTSPDAHVNLRSIAGRPVSRPDPCQRCKQNSSH